jgi:hypothetical protein
VSESSSDERAEEAEEGGYNSQTFVLFFSEISLSFSQMPMI